MARVRIGLTCAAGHFNEIGHLWEPVKDKDIDKLAERARLPAYCEMAELGDREATGPCVASFVGLPHAEGREREGEGLARVGGRNIHAGLQSRPKARPQEGPLNPLEWKRRIFERQRSRPGGPVLCAVTGEPLSFSFDEAHHPLEKTFLRERGLHMHVWDERNGMAVKRAVHNGHTNRSRPIPRRFVPASAFQFARELGPWAVARINEKHPK
jgi:hypothetical protein